MEKNRFEHILIDFVRDDPGNFVSVENALRPELAGMRIFESPLFGYADAADPLFAELKKPGIIGEFFIPPGEWLEGARTVVSLYFPFTQAVVQANRAGMEWPAEEWMHARVDGQAFQIKTGRRAVELLTQEGFAALMPMHDPRFLGRHPRIQDKSLQEFYTSNWSERHIAYACGLGTFGLSMGLITEKGCAGRCISLVTTALFEPKGRPYSRFDEYCCYCGDCADNCPVDAISREKGKLHPPCMDFLELVLERRKPYYGCGKCHVKVPCESGIPEKAST